MYICRKCWITLLVVSFLVIGSIILTSCSPQEQEEGLTTNNVHSAEDTANAIEQLSGLDIWGSTETEETKTLYPFQEDYLWGFIDAFGYVIIEPQFIRAYEFSDGLARVTLLEGTNAYIDRQGNIIDR